MICLTGDIHHSSLRTGNQQHCDITEIQVACRYLKLLEEAGVKATFFISGKCFAEEWEDLKPLTQSPLVEIGGHNWDCFQNTLFHRVCNKALGSYNGPLWFQRWDARRTAAIVQQKTGRTTRVWRNHMYMHGRHTERALAGANMRVCSDGVKRDCCSPVWHSAGIYNYPLNIIPDHEHLYHAERTREWVAWWQKRYDWSDDFGPDSYEVEEWTGIVLNGLRENEERGAVSNMIIHPITLYLCDKLASFQRILEFLRSHETVHMSRIIDDADRTRAQGTRP